MPYLYVLALIAITKYLISRVNHCSEQRKAQAEVAALKVNYQAGSQRIITVDSVCLELSTEQVLAQLTIDDAEHSPYDDQLCAISRADFAKGVLLTDRSGIAHYALGPLLAARWDEADLFGEYNLVLLLPIENITKLCPNEQPSMQALAKLWKVTHSVDLKKTLVIVTGHPGDQVKKDSLEVTARQNWLRVVESSGAGRLYISNKAISEVEVAQELPLSLKPLYLTAHHCAERAKAHVAFSVSGRDLMSEALRAQEQTLYIEDEKGSIETSEGWHQAILQLKPGAKFTGPTVRTKQIYPPLEFKEVMIRISHCAKMPIEASASGGGGGEKGSPESPGAVATPASGEQADDELRTPADWFSAAAATSTDLPDKPLNKSFGAYRLGDNLIIRRFSDQYVRAIDAASQASLPPLPLDDPAALDLISDVARSFFSTCDKDLKEDGFSKLLPFIKRKRKTIRKSMTAEEKRAQKGKIPGDKGMTYFFDDLRGEKKHKDKKLAQQRKTLALDFGHIFSDDAEEPTAYHDLQETLNRSINTGHFSASITQAMRDILSGKTKDANGDIVTALAATFIAEPARYPLSFIAGIMALDLFQLDSAKEVDHWRCAFCHPGHHDVKSGAWDYIVADFSHILGGILPMTHGNSYHQVSSTSRPEFGMDWVDFKIHLLTIHWLSQHIEKDQLFHPSLSGELSVTPPPEYPVITNTTVDPMSDGVRRLSLFSFDRFARRVVTFDMMLDFIPPLRDSLKEVSTVDEIFVGLDSFKLPKPICRVALSKANRELTHRMLAYSYIGMLKTALTGVHLIRSQQYIDFDRKSATPFDRELKPRRWEKMFNSLIYVDPEFWLLRYAYACILIQRMGRHYKAAVVIEVMRGLCQSEFIPNIVAPFRDRLCETYKKEIGIFQSITRSERTLEQWQHFLEIVQALDIYKHPIGHCLDDFYFYVHSYSPMATRKRPGPGFCTQAVYDHLAALSLLRKHRPDLARKERTQEIAIADGVNCIRQRHGHDIKLIHTDINSQRPVGIAFTV
jgi:hypothetical protein